LEADRHARARRSRLRFEQSRVACGCRSCGSTSSSRRPRRARRTCCTRTRATSRATRRTSARSSRPTCALRCAGLPRDSPDVAGQRRSAPVSACALV
jgi:hypothetical protein